MTGHFFTSYCDSDSTVGTVRRATLTLTTNKDCIFFIDGESKMQLTSGLMYELLLLPGIHQLEFFGIEESKHIKVEFEMPASNTTYDVLWQGEETKSTQKNVPPNYSKHRTMRLICIISSLVILIGIIIGLTISDKNKKRQDFATASFDKKNIAESKKSIGSSQIQPKDSSVENEVNDTDCNTVTDIDGNSYNIVEIGDQVWMSENLRTTRYPNGVSIPQDAKTSISSGSRYLPSGKNEVSKYGYLYNWTAVMNGSPSSKSIPSHVQGICPDGWHIPSEKEWQQLVSYLSSQSQFSCGNNSKNISKSLASTTNWKENGMKCTPGCHQEENNVTGFAAIPAGAYYFGGYSDFGKSAKFWSATESSSAGAVYYYIWHSDGEIGHYSDSKSVGFSVRCIQD